jgi:signal transduction histidine kinase
MKEASGTLGLARAAGRLVRLPTGHRAGHLGLGTLAPAGLGLLALVLVGPLSAWPGPVALAWIGHAAPAAAMALAAACSAFAASRVRGRDRTGLLLTAGAAGCWSGTQALQAAALSGPTQAGLAVAAAALSLLGTLLLLASIVALLGLDLGGAALARRVLDAVAVVGSLLLACHILVLRHALEREGLGLAGLAFTVVPAAGGAAAMGLALALFPHLPRPRRRLGAAWLAAWTPLVLAGLASALGRADGAGAAPLLGAGWALGGALLAFAAIRWTHVPPETCHPHELGRYCRHPLVVPVAAMALLALDLAGRGSAWSDPVPAIPILLALGVFLAVLARHGLYGGEFRLQAQRIIAAEDARQQELARAREAALRREHELDTARRQHALKTHLLNTASHELNTPLSALRLQLRVHRDQLGRRATPEDRRSLEALDRDVQRLAALVADTLDLARIQSGSFRVNLTALEFAGLAQDVAARMAPLAAQGRVELVLERDGPAWCEGDPARLAQALRNLLDHAIQDAPPGSKVRVAVRSAGGQVVCSVQDPGTGTGTAGPGHPALPPLSVQGEVDPRGGLGLFISRAIVERHGGALGRERHGRGKGSTFTFWLPVGRPAGPAAVQAAALPLASTA